MSTSVMVWGKSRWFLVMNRSARRRLRRWPGELRRRPSACIWPTGRWGVRRCHVYRARGEADQEPDLADRAITQWIAKPFGQQQDRADAHRSADTDAAPFRTATQRPSGWPGTEA